MARRSEQEPWRGISAYLKEARAAMLLSVEKVTDAYKERCKEAGIEPTGLSGVKSWLYGWTEPQVDDYRILSTVINDHLREIGRYDKLVPELRGRDSNPQPTVIGALAA